MKNNFQAKNFSTRSLPPLPRDPTTPKRQLHCASVPPTPPRRFPRAALFLRNERSRFKKRTQSFFKTNALVFQKHRTRFPISPPCRRNRAAPSPKRRRPAAARFLPKYLEMSPRIHTFAPAFARELKRGLSRGVMVTLQILVLPFPVRVRAGQPR